jgi:cytochrome c-type biogenesis protein CcmF
VGSVLLVVYRLPDLRSEGRLDSLLSREAVFLLNNLVLVALCGVIFWGTFFPLISEAITGTKSSVGPPWFDRYVTPLALILVLLAGVGPALTWGRASLTKLRRVFAVPGVVMLLALAALFAVGAGRNLAAIAMFSLAAFALATLIQEFWLGARARGAMRGEPPPLALLSLVRGNRRRYGGFVVHAGIVLLFVGVAASSAFQHVRDVRLSAGQTARVGGYDVTYVRPTSSLDSEKIALGAVLDVSRGGHHVATLLPSRNYYPSLDQASLGRIGRFFNGDSTSELGLRSSLRRDVWTAMQPDLHPLQRFVRDADRRFPDANPQLEGFVVSTLVHRYLAGPATAEFRLIVSPLVAWIWIGGVIVVGGAMIALFPVPAPRRRRAAVPATVPAAPGVGLAQGPS